HEPANLGKLTSPIQRRYGMACGQPDDREPIIRQQRRRRFYPCIFFSRIGLNTRSDTGQTLTQIPNRSAWASCKAALKAGSLILAKTGLRTSSCGPKYHTSHANGIEISPNQNKT